MVKVYDIALDNGRVENVVFNNYFLRLLSRLVTGGKAKTVEETIENVFGVVQKWQGLVDGEATSHTVFRDFDAVCIDLIPVFMCANNAYKELNGQPQDMTLEKAESVMNHIEIAGVMEMLNGLIECIIPQGLPEDKKKEEGVSVENPQPHGKK